MKLTTDLRVDDGESVDEVIYDVLRGLPSTCGAPTGVITADGHEVEFVGPHDEITTLRDVLDLRDD